MFSDQPLNVHQRIFVQPTLFALRGLFMSLRVVVQLRPYFTIICRLLLSALVAVWLSGCAMQPMTGPNGEHYVAFKNKKLISKERAKLLKREKRASVIQRDMKKVGFSVQPVSPVFDSINYSVLSIFRNQFELLEEYQTLVDNHKDVMSFINANEGKSAKELLEEAKRLDEQLKKQHDSDEKYVSIAEKMKRYQMATGRIYIENGRLAAELLVQGVRLAAVLQNNLEEIIGMEGFAMLLNAHKVAEQSQLTKARMHMSAVANEFIDDEKAVIDITKEIQKIIDNEI